MKYRSLHLLKAIGKGWRYDDLSAAELRLLAYVAQNGRHNEPGIAFAWHPMLGVEWWCEDMGMPRSTYFDAVASLRRKGFLETVPANATWRKPGVGIPDRVMDEVLAHTPVHRTPSVRSAVPDGPGSQTSTHALTSANVTHKQGTKQYGEQLFTQPPTELAVQDPSSSTTADANPEPEPQADRDGRMPEPRYRTTVAHRLMRDFHNGWVSARRKNPSLALYESPGVVGIGSTVR